MSCPERLTHPITALGEDGEVLWWGDPAVDPSWADHARCGPGVAEAFFPSRYQTARDGKALCAPCPVRFACLESGLGAGATDGIWGGHSATGRRFRRLRRDRLALARLRGKESGAGRRP